MTKSDKIYAKHFSHFAMRLAERYGIWITFEDYRFLCSLPFMKKTTVIRHESGLICRKGYIKVKGVKVLVVRYGGPYKVLITALPIPKKNAETKSIP